MGMFHPHHPLVFLQNPKHYLIIAVSDVMTQSIWKPVHRLAGRKETVLDFQQGEGKFLSPSSSISAQQLICPPI
jgi:hypothetical protein